MKIGDLVKPRPKYETIGIDYGYGLLLDIFEDEDGIMYFEVQWKHERQWWKPYEVELVCEGEAQ